jgi:hypothetical protein
MEKNVSETRRTDWDVSWDGVSCGLLKKVDPSKLKWMIDAIRTGTTGKMDLGGRFVGISGTAVVEIQQITTAAITQLQPWYPHAHPPLNKDLYDYAKQLVLHPADLPADAKDQDLVWVKAVPTGGYDLARDGEKDDVWPVEFMIYPDRDKLLAAPPWLFYGYIGAEAPTSPPAP